jgi:metallo-beta-lactamase class B
MFAKPVVLAALAALVGCAPGPRVATSTDSAAQGRALATACAGREGWSDAAPPARIFGNIYYVGTCGITVLLVTSPKGHILIDGATAQAVPSILANITALGFDLHDIRFIVGSHEHNDHMGGFAALKAATGAKLLVSAAARPVVETGRTDPADPQAMIIDEMTPVAVDRLLSDGEVVRVGDIALSAVATPGHTSGGTSWSWRSCEGEQCLSFAYVDSLTAVSADTYRFTDHPERVAPFRATFDRVAALKCDVMVTPHPGVSNLFARLSGNEPLVDRDACGRLAVAMRKRLDDRLAKEGGQ